MDRAALYVRVSTDEQTEYSPAVQLEALKKYAAEHNLYVDPAHIYADEGISGRRADKRPAFQSMIAAAKNHKFDVILVHKYDRFARSRDDSVLYKALLKKDGVRLISITEPIPDDDKFAVIYESMLEAMAEYYSLNLAEEVKKTMHKKAHLGEYQSAAPFGYKNENKSLTILPEEAAIIRYIFEQYTLNDKSQFEITREVNAMGAKTHRGNIFELRTVQYILHNPVYCGWVRWTPGRIKGRNFNNPDSIIAQGSHEPIISKELFDATQEKLRIKKRTTHRYAKPITEGLHWVSSLVKCSSCGRSLVISHFNKDGSFSMQCGGYNHGQCTISHSIKAEVLTEAILESLHQIALHGKADNTQILYFRNDTEENAQTALLQQAKTRLAKAKEAYLAGIDTLEEYKVNKQRYEAEIKAAEAKLKEFAAQAIPNDEFFERVGQVWKTLLDPSISMEQKKKAARSVIHQAVFNKNKNTIDVFLYFH